MPNVRFDIQVKLSETYYNIGKDEIQFLFAANKGTDFGIKWLLVGRCPRIMLAVKNISTIF
jgi:DNA repair protein RecN (Recombination protein N)